MKEVKIFTENHMSTKRDYLSRMINHKAQKMNIAMKYDEDYWDGERDTGYGGYRYDGRFQNIAKKIIEKYKLSNSSKILDFGCGKGFLLYEIYNLIGCKIIGLDISRYAVDNAKSEIKDFLEVASIERLLTFSENEFDLFISTMTLHNLGLEDLESAISSINKISKNSLITVESYRNSRELFNLQCWALTCRTFFNQIDWSYFLKKNNYKGDYELLYFE